MRILFLLLRRLGAKSKTVRTLSVSEKGKEGGYKKVGKKELKASHTANNKPQSKHNNILRKQLLAPIKKVMFWNCNGLVSPKKRKNLKKILDHPKYNDIDLIFLIETYGKDNILNAKNFKQIYSSAAIKINPKT